MAPSHDPENPRKQGPTPTRRRNDIHAAVQLSAAVNKRRKQCHGALIIRPELLAIPIPGLDDGPNPPSTITQMSPIAPAIGHGQAAPSTMLPQSLILPEHPTTYAQQSTHAPVSSLLGPHGALATVSPAYMDVSEGTGPQNDCPNQPNQLPFNDMVSSQQSAATECRPYDYHGYANLLNPGVNSTIPEIQAVSRQFNLQQPAQQPAPAQPAQPDRPPSSMFNSHVTLGVHDASVYHDPWREGYCLEYPVLRAPTPAQAWQRPSSGGTARSWQSEDMDISSDDDKQEGPLSVGALSLSGQTPPHQNMPPSTGEAQNPTSNGQEHVVATATVALNPTGSNLPHGEPRVPPTYLAIRRPQSSTVHANRLPPLSSEMAPEPSTPHPPAAIGSFSDSHVRGPQMYPNIDLDGALDDPGIVDHERPQEDLRGSGGDEDPYNRIAMLERQLGEQRLDLKDAHRKIDATDRKIDLLCEMVSRLDQARNALMTTSARASSPSPSAALVVVGSRSVPTGRQKVLRKRREPDELRIQKAIDGHWDKLMLTYEPPEEAVVKGYKLENGRACNANRFQPDHRQFVKSPWNTSVVEVFIDSLFASNHPDLPAPSKSGMRDTILRLAFSQLKTWRRNKMQEDKEEELIKKTKRRYERRRQSYLRRRNVAAAYADTHRHLDMVTYLDVEGMSSDESDHEASHGVPQYRINPKTWRHPGVEGCLRVLDALHRYHGFQDDYTAGPGARVHLRVAGGAESKRKPKKGLPHCLYNPELLSHPGAERLNAVPSAGYDFGHTPEIIDMAKPKNGNASLLGPFPEM